VCALAFASLSLRHLGMFTPLWCALGAVLFIDPWAVASPGFWLSFLATAVLMGGGHSELRSPVIKRHSTFATVWANSRTALSAQLLVTVGLVPISALLFGVFAVLSFPANLVAIPVVSFVVTPLVLLGSVWCAIGPSAFQIPTAIAWQSSAWVMQQLMRFLAWLEQFEASHLLLPLASSQTLVGQCSLLAGVAGVGLLMLAKRRLWRCMGFLLITPVLGVAQWAQAPAPRGLSITSFDLGAGSAILVQTPDLVLLFDTGGGQRIGQDAATKVILPYLRERGIRQLNYLVLSHADKEHLGGLASILGHLPVAAVVHGLRSEGDQWPDALTLAWDRARYQLGVANVRSKPPQVSSCTTAGSIGLGQTRLEFLSAPECVLRVNYAAAQGQPRSILLVGDASVAQQKKVLQENAPERLRADVMQIPGQGTKTTWAKDFVEAVQPKWALLQVSYKHWHGYPHANAVLPLTQIGATLLRSDLDGAVELRFDAQGRLSLWRSRTDQPRYYDY
jgi:competence protein ComEC